MVKIKNKKRLKWALRQYETGKSQQKHLAEMLNISPRRFRQLYDAYRHHGEAPAIGEQLGRPSKKLSEAHRAIIVEKHKRYCLNALYLEKVIYAENQIRIPHNAIHMVLLEEGLARKEPNKGGRRKPWIRYEREHSLSAGHLDWHEPEEGVKVCVVLDDASRKILAGGEFEHATEENSRKLVQEVLGMYGFIRTLREAITDHGSQFYANKRNREGGADHTFERFLKEAGIRHILCRYKHPQSNGKVEKWFDLYRVHRKRFRAFEEFVEWYNNRPHGSLNLRRAETPEKAFWRKMPEEYYYSLAAKYFGW
ncbi:transposase family protein [Candidatus Woesearchaeota archaeon]|nr:transposase family protein [Candidatus Woesearchaeota archaeon]